MKLPNILEREEVREQIRRALEEDLGPEGIDVTSVALVPESERAEAHLVARERCRLSGVDVAAAVFREVDPALECEATARDGTDVAAGEVVLKVSGSARSILTAERTALNFIQRMCGIATVTARYVAAAGNPRVQILDTRKTTPTLRTFEKYAVLCGGGTNHRYGLFDAVLIKDNHLAAWARHHGGVGEAVRAARERFPDLKIEVEVDTEEQLREALEARPDWVLLDNMSPERLRRCVELCRGVCRTEASGGITLETIAEVAATGVDAVSVGALTHSARAVDLALDFVS